MSRQRIVGRRQLRLFPPPPVPVAASVSEVAKRELVRTLAELMLEALGEPGKTEGGADEPSENHS